MEGLAGWRGRHKKLQTARFRTPEELQTRDLDQKKRLDELYLAIGGLGGQKLELDPIIAKKLIFVKNVIFSEKINLSPCQALHSAL